MNRSRSAMTPNPSPKDTRSEREKTRAAHDNTITPVEPVSQSSSYCFVCAPERRFSASLPTDVFRNQKGLNMDTRG